MENILAEIVIILLDKGFILEKYGKEYRGTNSKLGIKIFVLPKWMDYEEWHIGIVDGFRNPCWKSRPILADKYLKGL